MHFGWRSGPRDEPAAGQAQEHLKVGAHPGRGAVRTVASNLTCAYAMVLAGLMSGSAMAASTSAARLNPEDEAALGWAAGRLDYSYGASEVAAFVNTKDQVQLQVVLCALNEASPFRLSVLLPHPVSSLGIIPVKLHVDGTVTHVYAEVVGNALEFQIDSAFLLTLPDSPTFELEFSPEDAACLKVPKLLSFPMERAHLVLSEVARSCKLLSEQQGFATAPELIAGILWPRHGFNSTTTLNQFVRQDPERAQQLVASEYEQSLADSAFHQALTSSEKSTARDQVRAAFRQRITHINGMPVLSPIDLERACIRPRQAQSEQARVALPAPDAAQGTRGSVVAAAASAFAPYGASAGARSGTRAEERLGTLSGARSTAPGAQAGGARAAEATVTDPAAQRHAFAPSHWSKREAAEQQAQAHQGGGARGTEPMTFVLSEQCRLALDQVYARTGHEALSYLRELFLQPGGSYQRYAQRWISVMEDAVRLDFEKPQIARARVERAAQLMQDYDYYLALYTLFSSGLSHLTQYPQSYYDLTQRGKDPSTFLYAMDNRYELETVKYASVLVRRLTGFITPRRNVEEALTAWWSFYQELCVLLPPLVRAQSIRPVVYRQMLMRLWQQAGYPEGLHLRPEYAYVQGRNGKIATGESLEAKCSMFEGSTNDQFFFASPECEAIISTDMRLLGYNNEDLRQVWRHWHEYLDAWHRSPFAHNQGSGSAGVNLESNLPLTLLSLYKSYGFGDYYLLRKCISSRDSDICAYETFKNKESYQSDLRKSIATLSKLSRREAKSLSELDRLWQRYYESLCTFTDNLVARGMLSPWRAPFVQGVAVTAQAEAMINGLFPSVSGDEF